MSKVELDPIASGYNLSKINNNFQKIESELNNKVLYRDSPAGEPNHMEVDLDMNDHSILNARNISADSIWIDGVPVIPGDVVVGDITLRADLADDGGSGLVGYKYPTTESLERTVFDRLREKASLLDFMTPAQRDAVHSGVPVDHQSAFTKAMAWLAGGKKTLTIPFGTYQFTDTFDIPAEAGVYIDPKATLNFTSTTSVVIRIRRAVMFYGNMAKLRMTHPAWDGIAVYFNGEDQFDAETPCFGTGLDIGNATYNQGTAIHIEALGPRHYVHFVKFSDWMFGFNLNYGITMNCGSAGNSDPTTWHWITSNTFNNITSYAFHLISMVGTPGVPAEVAGNVISNFHHLGYNDAGLPIYLSGPTQNILQGYIWDWNNANGSPMFFEGGSEHNQVHVYADASTVFNGGGPDVKKNQIKDYVGGNIGQKQFFSPVVFSDQTLHGVVGTAGLYATTYNPDNVGGQIFWRKNTNDKYTLGFGADPYTGTEAYSFNAFNRHTFGGGTNPTESRVRINGEPNKGVQAIRMGSDGFAGILFENSAGVSAGLIQVNTTNTVYSTSSDYRLKDNITNVVDSGDFIDAMRPVSWDWKVNGERGVGFIAHELQAISPTSVTGVKDDEQDEIGEDGKPTGSKVPRYQSVEYGSAEVIANMVAELQALRARVSELESKL